MIDDCSGKVFSIKNLTMTGSTSFFSFARDSTSVKMFDVVTIFFFYKWTIQKRIRFSPRWSFYSTSYGYADLDNNFEIEDMMLALVPRKNCSALLDFRRNGRKVLCMYAFNYFFFSLSLSLGHDI